MLAAYVVRPRIVELSSKHKIVSRVAEGMIAVVLGGLPRCVGEFVKRTTWVARHAVSERLRPRRSMAAGFIRDITRSRAELLAENVLLRHQLIVAERHIKKPLLHPHERVFMVGLAAITTGWRGATLLVQPDTVLRWHRKGFRLLSRAKSKVASRKPRIALETIALIRRIATENRLWGAERIRGELLKLGIQVCKRTIQKYMRRARGPRPWGQSWSTFLRNHAHQVWACDFLQTYDIWFRPIFAFFIIELGSRNVVHVAVTRSPNAIWVAQQFRNVTPFGEGPRFIIRDNDDKFTAEFDRAAKGAGTRVLRTAVKAPLMNSFCERFLGSARREILDHVIILGESHLQRVLEEYCFRYFNAARPHQGLGQLIPIGSSTSAAGGDDVVAIPVLNGLHHDYRRAA